MNEKLSHQGDYIPQDDMEGVDSDEWVTSLFCEILLIHKFVLIIFCVFLTFMKHFICCFKLSSNLNKIKNIHFNQTWF